jgi:glycerol kinase
MPAHPRPRACSHRRLDARRQPWEGSSAAYALEGAIFVTGAVVQRLRDGPAISSAAEVLAQSVGDSGGVYVVPAFTGLGSPWWDPYARGTSWASRGSTCPPRRAVVEAMAYQTRDAVDAMSTAAGVRIADLRVDGGASAMDFMLQLQADQLGVTVRRPADQETTALGAAYLAGLAEGVWPSLDAIAAEWCVDAVFEPEPDRTFTDLAHATWQRAVACSRNWVSH